MNISTGKKQNSRTVQKLWTSFASVSPSQKPVEAIFCSLALLVSLYNCTENWCQVLLYNTLVHLCEFTIHFHYKAFIHINEKEESKISKPKFGFLTSIKLK